MKRLTDEEIKIESHKVLHYVNDLCEKNGIKLFLGYGTALGAVRHKGFIPWDDDIDIMMYRDDYYKFREIIAKENGRYILSDIYNDENYMLAMPKVCDTMTYSEWPVCRYPFSYGVWVDIFLIDNLPDSYNERQHFFKKQRLLQSMYNHSLYKFRYTGMVNLVKSIVFSWTKLLGTRYFVKKLDEFSQKYNNQETKSIGVSIFNINNLERAVMTRKMLGNGCSVDFEGEKYLVPEDYDAYLRGLYRDYMQLPPVEKRVNHHSIKLFYK